MAERFQVDRKSAEQFQKVVGAINKLRLDSSPRKFTGRGYSIRTPKNIIPFPDAYKVEKQGEYKFFYIAYDKLEQATLQALTYHCEELILKVLKDEINRLQAEQRPSEELEEIILQLIASPDLQAKHTPTSKVFRLRLEGLLNSLKPATVTQSRTDSRESLD